MFLLETGRVVGKLDQHVQMFVPFLPATIARKRSGLFVEADLRIAAKRAHRIIRKLQRFGDSFHVRQEELLPVTASHPFSQFSHLGIRNGARVETTGLQIFPTDQGNGIETFVESLQEILLLRRQ